MGEEEEEKEEQEDEVGVPDRPQTKAQRLAAQEAEAIVVQAELDEQFARDVEAATARSSPTPAPRAKRVRKSVRFARE